MNGQWMGQYSGSSTGSLIVNIDDMGNYYEGVAFLVDTNNKLPTTLVHLKTSDKAKDFQFKTSVILPIDPRTRFAYPWDKVKEVFPGVSFSKEAEVRGNWDEKRLIVNWTTDIGVAGSATLPKSKSGELSEYVPVLKNWDSYKDYVSKLESRRYLFRGQKAPWRLRTKFHRTGRADLGRFVNEDIQILHKHLSARTRHVYNLDIGNENGSFFNLVQHHGYPTPLLDWTYSPYVAIFFAYRDIPNFEAAKSPSDKKVRIIVFDQKQWRNDFEQVQHLDVAFPHFSIMEFLAIDNERMIPQQSASSVANIDDIESYIKSKDDKDKKYMHVIDLPMSERTKVMRELSCMGITAGSLFPGLDGACEELRERFFEI